MVSGARCKPVWVTTLVFVAILAGCAAPKPTPKPIATVAQCTAPKAGDAFSGSWLGVRKQKGISGELHVFMRFEADGVMSYTEQLKRGNKTRQALSETGCWSRVNSSVVLQTTKSNGSPVEVDDPIYRNEYEVRAHSAKSLTLGGPEGDFTLRRMPDSYRPPSF